MPIICFVGLNLFHANFSIHSNLLKKNSMFFMYAIKQIRFMYDSNGHATAILCFSYSCVFGILRINKALKVWKCALADWAGYLTTWEQVSCRRNSCFVMSSMLYVMFFLSFLVPQDEYPLAVEPSVHGHGTWLWHFVRIFSSWPVSWWNHVLSASPYKSAQPHEPVKI